MKERKQKTTTKKKDKKTGKNKLTKKIFVSP